MDNKTIEIVQQKQFEILIDIDRICKKLGTQYFLCCGTLLGTIRHKGAIPWDDDLDVGFLREDYEKFIDGAEKELDMRFFLQTWHSDECYALPHCKIRDKYSHYIETANKFSGCADGISVDVLPFDNVPNGKLLRYLHGITLYNILNVIKVKRRWTFIENDRVGFLKKCIYVLVAKLSNDKDLIRLYERLVITFNRKDNMVFVSDTAGLDYFRFVEKRSRYIDLTKGEYRGIMFSIPKEYDAILSNSYGNYMCLPPFEDRVGQPGIESVEIF